MDEFDEFREVLTLSTPRLVCDLAGETYSLQYQPPGYRLHGHFQLVRTAGQQRRQRHAEAVVVFYTECLDLR